MGTAAEHPVPGRVKPASVIFDILTLLTLNPECVSECPDVKSDKWGLNPVWHMMLYGCIHIMTSVGVKGLNRFCNDHRGSSPVDRLSCPMTLTCVNFFPRIRFPLSTVRISWSFSLISFCMKVKLAVFYNWLQNVASTHFSLIIC